MIGELQDEPDVLSAEGDYCPFVLGAMEALLLNLRAMKSINEKLSSQTEDFQEEEVSKSMETRVTTPSTFLRGAV